jgi:hypothetical protein
MEPVAKLVVWQALEKELTVLLLSHIWVAGRHGD